MTTITPLPPPPSRSDPANFASKGDALLGALPTFVTEVNTVAGEVNTNATTATTQAGIATTQAGIATTQAGLATTNGAAQVALATAQANAAAASALTAINAPGTNATSTTSDTVALGSTTITIQTGKALAVGMFILAASTASPANYNYGQITAYDSGTGVLTFNVLLTGGGGTFAAWTVSLAAITSAAQPMTKAAVYFYAHN